MNTYSSKNKFSIIQMHSRDSIHICWLSPLPGAHLEPTDKTALWLCAPSLVSAKCLHQPAPFRSMPPSKRPRSRLVTFPGASSLGQPLPAPSTAHSAPPLPGSAAASASALPEHAVLLCGCLLTLGWPEPHCEPPQNSKYLILSPAQLDRPRVWTLSKHS